MRILIIIGILTICFLSINSYGSEYEIKPKYVDFNSNDGFMDVGSYNNPYVVKNQQGNEVAEIRPKFMDFLVAIICAAAN